MDLDMPEMNGFEALSEIRKNKKLKDLKVIASTATSSLMEMKNFLNLVLTPIFQSLSNWINFIPCWKKCLVRLIPKIQANHVFISYI